MGKYFGTDGFRGEANVDLTVEHAYKVGRFLTVSKSLDINALDIILLMLSISLAIAFKF